MKSTFLAAPAFFLLSLLITTPSIVHAGPYTLQAPTSATRWMAGQPGIVTVISTDKADAKTKPSDRLLTITLRIAKGGIFGGSTVVAVIRDGVQLLVPLKGAERQVKLDVNDWVVPATGIAPGDKYFVQVARAKDGFFDIPDKVDSAHFQIVAAPAPPTTSPSPTGNTSVSTLPTPTANTTMPLPTITATPTLTPAPVPTLPPGQTCADIQKQCQEQSRVYIEANETTVCQCGVNIIQPIVKDNGAPSGYHVGRGREEGVMAAVVMVLSVVMATTL
ncbi:hypothetical protein FBU30_001069 [Linnemannia zychae]|nr:hypothetical protein FBU30_001069 [Linnemannia zychae]